MKEMWVREEGKRKWGRKIKNKYEISKKIKHRKKGLLWINGKKIVEIKNKGEKCEKEGKKINHEEKI